MEVPSPTVCLLDVLKLTECLADRVLSDHLLGRSARLDHIRLLAGVGLVLHDHEIAFPPLLNRALDLAVANCDARVDPVKQCRDYVTSPEFQAHHSSLSSRAYIEMLYNDYLGRSVEPAGLKIWGAEIDSGKLDRTSVAACIIDSVEFRNRFQA